MDKRKIKEYKSIKAAAAMLEKELQELQTFQEPDQELITKLQQREAEYNNTLQEIENWLEDIKDPVIHTIFRMKLYENASDLEISEALNYSRSMITRLKNEYLNGGTP